MSSQANGGLKVPGNLAVYGDTAINGAATVGETLAVTGLTTLAGITSSSTVTAPSADITSRIKLTPLGSAPSGAAEGMLYAGTDHKLYYHNGTTWKEVAFV